MATTQWHSKVPWLLRELFALAIWCALFIHLFVYDLAAVVQTVNFPALQWCYRHRLVTFALVVTICWLAFGHKKFWAFLSFVALYPLINLFWRTPKLAWKNWPLVVAFLPGLYEIFAELRATILFYVLAAFAATLILTLDNPHLLAGAAVTMGVFLVWSIFKAFRRAYKESVFARAGRMLQTISNSVRNGEVDLKIAEKIDRTSSAGEGRFHTQLTVYYACHSCIEFAQQKLDAFIRSRKLELYLIASWLYTFLLTLIAFSFVYTALHKIDASSFHGVANPDFAEFFLKSANLMTSANVSELIPKTSLVKGVCLAQSGFTILLVVILLFTILTAAREQYKEDVQTIIKQLKMIAASVEESLGSLYSITFSEVERLLVEKKDSDVKMVNWFRRAKGLPEIPKPAGEIPENPTEDSNQPNQSQPPPHTTETKQ